MIAFASRQSVLGFGETQFNIWVTNLDGSGAHPLTGSGPADALNVEPHWSPDGNRIAFVRCPNTANGCELAGEINVMNADGTEAQRVTTGSSPSWSPDGKQLVFMDRFDGSEGAGTAAYRVRADSTGRTAIGVPGCFVGPRWSPVGDRLLFYDPGCSAAPGLYTSRLDGSSRNAITPQAFEGGIFGSWDWAPDGSAVVFDWADADATDPTTDLYRLDLESGDIVDVTPTPDPVREVDPAWSPDGRLLLYDTGGDLWTTSTQGGEPSRLMSTSWAEMQPSWQPCVSQLTVSCKATKPSTPPPPPPPSPPLSGEPRSARPARPTVRVLSRALLAHPDRTLRILIRCPRLAIGGCRGRITLSSAVGERVLTLGGGNFRVGAGANRVRIRLSSAGMRVLVHFGRLRARIVVDARDGLGHRRTTSAFVVVSAPRAIRSTARP